MLDFRRQAKFFFDLLLNQVFFSSFVLNEKIFIGSLS